MVDYFKSNSKLALKLFTIACDESPNQNNILISPFAMQLCLASIYVSSSDDEKSAELLKLLQLSIKTSVNELLDIFGSVFQPDSEFFNFNIYNKFLIENGKTLNNEFIKTIFDKIKTEVSNIDFTSTQRNIEKINSKCFKRTEEKINQIVNESDFQLSNDMILILNAASLNASWDVSFPQSDENSVKGDFHLNKNDKIKIDMMENTIPFYKYGEFNEYGIRVAELRYAGYYENELSMLVLLPQENKTIKDILTIIEDIDIFDLCGKLHEIPMWIKFPKFKMETKIDFLKIITKLDDANLWNGNVKFSQLIQNDAELKINKIIHKAEVESNEIGTHDKELPRHLAICSELPNLVQFFVDRPFIYVIRDQNAIYFIGKVTYLT